MKKLIKSLLFAVPYPAAIIWHLILGGFVAFLLVAICTGSTKAAATYAVGGIGAGIGLVLGLLVWLLSRHNTLNDRAAK